MGWSLAETGFVLFLGLVLGSFATALAWRVPRDLSWIRADETEKGKAARSACPKCKRILSVQDLVPVFSWILLRGKCRYCGASIGILYPAMELLTLAGCLGVYFSWGFTISAFLIMVTLPFLVALLVIDTESFVLPDQLVFITAVLAVVFILYQGVGGSYEHMFAKVFFGRLLSGVVFAGLVFLIGMILRFFLKKETLGFGDVKFFAAAGLWLGLSYLPFFLIFSGAAGVLMGGAYRVFLNKTLFPFGPALILALYAGFLLMGQGIVPLIDVR